MLSDLEQLRDRLKHAQTELLLLTAKAKVLPSDGTLRKIADLEISLGAIEALIDERSPRGSSSAR